MTMRSPERRPAVAITGGLNGASSFTSIS